MNKEIWNYKGYRKMNLLDVDQKDWNTTILTTINTVYGDIDCKKKVFVSENLMSIFKSIYGYDESSNIILNKYYIEILMMTSNIIYVTDLDVEDFNLIDVNNVKMIEVENYEY